MSRRPESSYVGFRDEVDCECCTAGLKKERGERIIRAVALGQ